MRCSYGLVVTLPTGAPTTAYVGPGASTMRAQSRTQAGREQDLGDWQRDIRADTAARLELRRPRGDLHLDLVAASMRRWPSPAEARGASCSEGSTTRPRSGTAPLDPTLTRYLTRRYSTRALSRNRSG